MKPLQATYPLFPGRRPPNRPHRPGCAPEGFTLLETLVAVMILAISLMILLQLLSQDLQSAGYSLDYSRAVLLARMKMEELLVREAPSAMPLAGDFDGGYAWSADYHAPPTPTIAAGGLAPVELTVEVRWGQGERVRRVRLSTLKLFPADEGS